MTPNRNQAQPVHDPSGRGTRREFTLLNYWELVIRRLWTIVPIAVAVFVVTALWTFLQPRVYVSNASFMLEPKETSFDERAFFGQDQTRPLAYYQSIIRSVQFRQQLEDSLRKNLPGRNEKGQPYILKDIRAMAKEGLSLRIGDYENMVRLTARANDPLLAFKAAVFSADLLKNRAQELDREELSNAVNFIEQQKAMAIEQLEAAEKALQEFKEKSSVVVLEAGRRGGRTAEARESAGRGADPETARHGQSQGIREPAQPVRQGCAPAFRLRAVRGRGSQARSG